MIYLASQSPRRRELLSQIGVHYQLVHADIDETPLTGESALDYVIRMAREKALCVAGQYPDKPLLAADTTVVCENNILGNPRDRSHYLEMMSCLSGNSHEVITAIAVTLGPDPASLASATSTSKIHRSGRVS